jgi:hypothetical protein
MYLQVNRLGGFEVDWHAALVWGNLKLQKIMRFFDRFFDIPFSKFLVLLAVVAAGIYWLSRDLPTTTSSGAVPQGYSGDIRSSCYAEKIRLGGARFVLQQMTTSSDDIKRFNQMVDAYNQGCGTRRYKRKDYAIIETIESEVRANRDALWAEGIARFPAAARWLASQTDRKPLSFESIPQHLEQSQPK